MLEEIVVGERSNLYPTLSLLIALM